MNKIINEIDAVIFDVGNVLVHIDWRNTCRELEIFEEKIQNDFFKKIINSNIFFDFEKDLISPKQFYDFVCKESGLLCSYESFVTAWNKTLCSNAQGIGELLANLKTKGKKLYTLSNTNTLHVEEFQTRDIFTHFDYIYTSCNLHERKPDIKIYTDLLKSIGLRPEKTLFIDDLEENINAANSIGMKTYHLTSHKLFYNFIYEI